MGIMCIRRESGGTLVSTFKNILFPYALNKTSPDLTIQDNFFRKYFRKIAVSISSGTNLKKGHICYSALGFIL